MSISRKILVTAAAAAAVLATGCGGQDEAADKTHAPAVRQSAFTEQVDLHAAAAEASEPTRPRHLDRRK